MKRNVNRISNNAVICRCFCDSGKIIPVKVDNFPADNPAYVKSDGFRCNDISLLDRMSFDSSFDSDFAKIVASRVKENQSQPVSTLSEEQLIRTLRPAWVQTASEIKQFDESVYQYMTTTRMDDEQRDEVKEAAVAASVSKEDDSKTE